jgi:Holliday junction resolvase RusA-like endonuclease
MIKLTIPGIPPSLNKWSRMHWAQASSIKKQWEQDIYYLSSDQRYKHREKLPLTQAKVRIRFFFKTHANRDIDNMNQKFLLDGLVKAGILADDNTKVIGQVEIIPEYDKHNPRVEVEIFETL